MRANRIPARTGWYVLLVMASFLPLMKGFTDFIYLSGEKYSDLVVAHLPNIIYLRKAILEFSVIPFWSPAILSGSPIFANPLSGFWYPPGWLTVVWPQPWAFNLLAGMHLAWGGLGMVHLLKREGLGTVSAWFGALAFAMLPKMLAHYGSGHISLVYAVSWTSWLLWSVHGDGRKGILPGVLLAVIFVADPRWAAYSGILWLVYSFAHSQELRKYDRNASGLAITFRKHSTEILLACALSAPLLIPLLEFTSHSTRAGMSVADVLIFSLPPARILGLFFPDFGNFTEWVLYPGCVVLLLVVVGLVQTEQMRKGVQPFPKRFWVGTALVVLLFSFGNSIPVLRLWAYLPGANLLRVPPRAMFVFGMSLAALAAYGLDCLRVAGLAPGDDRQAAHRRTNLMMAALGFFWVAFSTLVWAVSGSLPLSFLWGACAGLAGIAAIAILERNPGAAWPLALLFALLVADLGGVNLQTLEPRSSDEVFSESRALAKWLSEQPGDFRVYSPSYSLPQHTAAAFGLELADGVDPLQLRGYAEVMEHASGVPSGGYSVTVPPFAGEDIASANEAFTPDAALLGEWNVAYVVSAFEISAEGLVQERLIDGVHVYRNQLVRPRAREVDSGSPVAYDWSPNRIDFDVAETSGPIRFMLPAYPRWLVLADGRALPGQAWLSDLDSISFPPGTRTLSLVFVPTSLYAGLAIFLLAFAWLALRARRAR